jgi:hypothetical protein
LYYYLMYLCFIIITLKRNTMTTTFTKAEQNAIELIQNGANFNGKVYQSRKGAQIYVKNMCFNIQQENVSFFENLKQSRINTSLGFAVNMNNRSEVARANRLGYDAIEG